MIAPDYVAYDKLIKEYLRDYRHITKSFTHGWEIMYDAYDEPICPVPVMEVVLKDDADIIGDLLNNTSIRVRKPTTH